MGGVNLTKRISAVEGRVRIAEESLAGILHNVKQIDPRLRDLVRAEELERGIGRAMPVEGQLEIYGRGVAQVPVLGNRIERIEESVGPVVT